MAAVSDCFSIGSTVACTTCFKKEIVGEVLAFDQQARMLILKCATPDSAKLHDVYIVNISLCQDIQVKKEPQALPEHPPSLNLTRLGTRVRNQVEQKRRLVSALTAGVSREGQKLYMAITKTITEVTWSGPNIVVFNDVVITPPYTVDNVTGAPGSRQLTYVKKIVEKHTSNASSSDALSLSLNSSGVGGSGGGGNSSATASSEETSPTPPQTTTSVSKNSF